MEAAGGHRARIVVGGFKRFCDLQGIGDQARSHALVEAYCATALGGAADATKGTYRSVLRQRAGVVLLPSRPRYRGAPAKAPYSPSERAELVAISKAQPRRWRRDGALVVVALGMGAGLRAGEIVGARARDVRSVETGVVVDVGGARSRTVCVEAPFGAIAQELATGHGCDHLFRPGQATRRYHNFVNELCRSLVADPHAPRLSVARCRSSYICDRLQGGMALAELLAAMGICEVESLLRYAVHVEGAPATKAELRRLLEDQRGR